MYKFIVLVCLLCCGIMGIAIQSIASSLPYDIDPAVYGMPSKLQSLTDISSYRPTDLGGVPILDRTKILLTWLQKEFQSPSLTREGLGGGPISSNYIQAQIAKALRKGDPLLLCSVAQDASLLPAVRNGAVLALGLMGDADQSQQILHIMEFDDNPYYRALAMDTASCLGIVDALPILKDATNDPFVVYLYGKEPVYPVQRAATVNTRMLSVSPDKLQIRVNQLKNKFRSRLDSAQKAAQAEAESTPK